MITPEAVVILATGFLILATFGLYGLYLWECDAMPMNERCGDCGRPADYFCEERTLGPKVKVPQKDGTTKLVEPYEHTYRCADCTARAVAGDEPPRRVEALPHHQQILKAADPDDHAGELLSLGEDWGRR